MPVYHFKLFARSRTGDPTDTSGLAARCKIRGGGGVSGDSKSPRVVHVAGYAQGQLEAQAACYWHGFTSPDFLRVVKNGAHKRTSVIRALSGC